MDACSRIHGWRLMWQPCTRIRCMHTRTCSSNATQSPCPSFMANASAVMPCCGDGSVHAQWSQHHRAQAAVSCKPYTQVVTTFTNRRLPLFPSQTRLFHCTNSKGEHDPKYRYSRYSYPIDNPITLPLSTRPRGLNMIHRTN